jgi:glycosyltransferase involved in cell wall biosynthesis
MKIGIDARLYGIKDRGIGRYAERLIAYLEKIDTQNEYFIFLRQDGFKNYLPQHKNFHKILADFQPYSLKEQITFPCQLKKCKLDLVHFLHFNVPIFYRRSFVVTIHDLIITRFPDSRRKSTRLPLFLYYLKLFFYNLVLKNALKKSKKIIAVSEATKKEIISLFNIDFPKINVIYEGVDKISITGRQSPITDPYILYVGAAYPHKNLERLIIAFEKFIKNSESPISKRIKLVLVGKSDYFYERIKKLIEKLNLIDDVVLTGEVSDENLASYYKNALFFIFPSLAEGFGLPALEALNYGIPVASSNVYSLPEILGQSAYYFNPRDINEITSAIETMSTDDKLKQDLIAQGKAQSEKFSWQKMAEQIAKIYTT